ncbi:DUF7793 family protein [Demequina lutea]|uniref:DUF7793 domain-containing protein n=1 Tax=Demequina lutea TaxID=431489 RepID=A0A7Y9ZAX9_9MICO|nr:STAS/SEC14 domain-containing protein [Demequina lutea]NYI41465.1 hypothetical protein [Demequina lutea]
MSGESTEIVHAKFRMWLRPDGIVYLVWGSGVAIGLEDAVAATSAMAELTGGKRAPLLVDAHDILTQDRSARLEFVRRHDLVAAVALIVGTPVSRLMGNFYLSVSKPAASTRLFDDDASAIAWLQGFAG